MSHFITIPTNENGIYFDATQGKVLAEAVADKPFGFTDFFLYSHGWGTNADTASVNYTQFSIELAKQILTIDGGPMPFANPPGASLGIGFRWPSEITEDPNSALNAAQLFTFYTMEHRADAVGKNAGYSVIRQILEARARGTVLRSRIFLLGHSFGCKVVCAALQDLWIDIQNGTIPFTDGIEFRAVLLEPATDNDNLEPDDIYGGVSQIPRLRLLTTKSAADTALGTWYPLAGDLVNLFHTRLALGSTGPTVPTVDAFGGSTSLSVGLGFTPDSVAAASSRLIVADLTSVHEARAASGQFTGGGIAGSHADIFFGEIYNLVAGFLFA